MIRLLASLAATAAFGAPGLPHYHAFVGGGGAGPPSHTYRVGDSVYLAFTDNRSAPTRYRVCWGPAAAKAVRCWSRTAAVQTHPDIVGLLPVRAPGRWIAHWYVHGRAVGAWTFMVGAGD